MSTAKNRESDGGVARHSRIKSAERTLIIFEYFEATRMPATLGEIAQALGFPVSSTLALLRSLQDSGYLVNDLARKTYFPSLRLATLGAWLSESAFHHQGLLRLIDELAQETNETIFLGIQNGLSAQYIHVVQAEHVLRYHPPVGTKRPMLRSAVGRVLLAGMPDKQALKLIQKIVSRGEGGDEGPSLNVEHLLDDLRRVREMGYAYSANKITPGAAVVAVHLPGAGGRPDMAIGIGGPSDRVGNHQVQLRDTIRQAIARLEN